MKVKVAWSESRTSCSQQKKQMTSLEFTVVVAKEATLSVKAMLILQYLNLVWEWESSGLIPLKILDPQIPPNPLNQQRGYIFIKN